MTTFCTTSGTAAASALTSRAEEFSIELRVTKAGGVAIVALNCSATDLGSSAAMIALTTATPSRALLGAAD